MQQLNSIDAIVDRYDHFIFDQWGVLHDGLKAFPSSIACLEQLKARGKHIYLLSNSSRTAAENSEKLFALGYPQSFFDFVLTSGEILKRKLVDDLTFLHQVGSSCFIIGQEKSLLLDGTAIQVVPLEDATFVLLVGLNPDRDAIKILMPVLHSVAERHLPMLCANSDLFFTYGKDIFPGSGQAAQIYEKLGGQVFHFGKPHQIAFDEIVKRSSAPRNRSVMIGDSLEHDILGAVNAGIDSIFITSGIHKDELQNPSNPAYREDSLALCVRHNIRPQWILDELRWH